MKTEWFVNQRSLPKGPYGVDEIRDLALNGKIDPDTSVRKGADGKWVQAGKVKGLFDDDGTPVDPSKQKSADGNGKTTAAANGRMTAIGQSDSVVKNAVQPTPNQASTNQALTASKRTSSKLIEAATGPVATSNHSFSAGAQPVYLPPSPLPPSAPLVSPASLPRFQLPPRKSKAIAGMLAIIPITGALGIHDFYLGKHTTALLKIFFVIGTLCLGLFVTKIWGLIDGLVILSGNGRDGWGRDLV